jgi:CxxC motif-containing protein (DUF1111 family)
MFHRSRLKLSPRRRFRLPLLAASIGIIAACERPITTGTTAGEAPSLHQQAALGEVPQVARSLPFLSRDQRRLFKEGSVVFQTVFTPETGLGPLFNSTACAGCHEEPVVGGNGGNEEEEAAEDVEIHATAFQGGVCNDLSAVGGQVIQQQVTPALAEALGIEREEVPAQATAFGRRTTPDLLGFGLLDAVPEEEILRHADPGDRDHDGISGRPNRTAAGRVGRFGRKAQEATLREFNGGAFVMEMGITNPLSLVEQTVAGEPLPPGVDPTGEAEITQEQVDAADGFVRLLAPPRPLGLTFARQEGRRIFRRIGCADCHLPALKTGRNSIRALSFQVVAAYTDLLLHDMGPDLADICLGDAKPSEFRTEPLMGLRFVTAFLHDGRATTIEEAIGLHAGEAQAARDRFMSLSRRNRTALLRFLKGL